LLKIFKVINEIKIKGLSIFQNNLTVYDTNKNINVNTKQKIFLGLFRVLDIEVMHSMINVSHNFYK